MAEEKTVTTENFPPPIAHIHKYFYFGHLPEHLQDISSRFFDLATWMALELPSNPETTVALRKLLEAKDAAVRSRIEPPETFPKDIRKEALRNLAAGLTKTIEESYPNDENRSKLLDRISEFAKLAMR